MTDYGLSFPSEITAWRFGAELACSMLIEIRETDPEERRPTRNVVAAYLTKLRDINDTRAELAFAAILTDQLSSMLGPKTES